eukprot:TRINITY_DN27193_c0_g1_i1.p1 TRINITY_DN27193_c0_g1~~TRINITY_DN27193_c0_g1_i1.p1  ORF type:complete len:270 (+),score=48.95 TRINITY_DN27193_c0_g1_i1:62-811(+)
MRPKTHKYKAIAALCMIGLIAFAMLYERPGKGMHVEVIIVPGGGQTPEGPPEHQKLRLNEAARLYREKKGEVKILVLSGGTPHKPNPMDPHGFDIKEGECSAKYLMSVLNVPGDDILEEDFSLDTLGNAFWARTVHTDPAGFRKLTVVNNHWHMPRTKAIFDWVFSLPPVHTAAYSITYVEVADGLPDDILESRLEKESAALPGVTKLSNTIHTLSQFHAFLFRAHGAYKSSRLLKERATINPSLAKSY